MAAEPINGHGYSGAVFAAGVAGRTCRRTQRWAGDARRRWTSRERLLCEVGAYFTERRGAELLQARFTVDVGEVDVNGSAFVLDCADHVPNLQ